MSHASHHLSCQESQQVAVQTAVTARLAGCTLALGYWTLMGDVKMLLIWTLFLLLAFTPLLVLANFLGLMVYQLFHRTEVPFPLFLRICALLFEVTLFTWQVLYLIQIHPDEWRLLNGRY